MARRDARTEISELVEGQVAAWCAGDAVAFSRRVTDDAVFTNIFGQQFTGRAAFEKQHAFIFGSVYAGSRLKQEIAHLRFLSDDIAVLDTNSEVSGAKRLPRGYQSDDGVLRTKLLQVLEKQAGEWRIAAFHNVVVNPPPDPP
jgi:uncharacterized protein (TIGR02246 family)